MAKDILLEIGLEEVPAKFMPSALRQLAEMAAEKMAAARITYGEIKTLGTPRRLTLIVRGASEQQNDRISENKGPSVKIAYDDQGNPTKAAEGFARGQGVRAADLVSRDGYVYAVVEEKGRPVADLLPELLADIIDSLSFPKNMRWGSLEMRFARPIRWLVALYGGAAVIPLTVAEVSAGNITYGHRFLSQGGIAVTSAEEYLEKLAAHYVIADVDTRRAMIRRQVEELAVQEGGIAVIDESLLEEVLYLVEYPTALCGRFEETYLSLPPEAVITPMREHQRYFPLFGADGALLPKFITVRNGGAEHLDTVRRGNERVLKARLADARFFFEEDRKTPLADRVESLKTIVFQEGLGTLYDKTLRLQQLAAWICRENAETDPLNDAERAAYLAKADLATGMVCEFTELQGVMGREYARLSGESDAVALAIYEHYLPRFAGDDLPATAAGQAVSVADKVDNIVATFSRGLIPTGSQDPFALRRQALGIVHILIKSRRRLSLERLLSYAMDLLGITDDRRRSKLHSGLADFFQLRIKNILADEKHRHDYIDAVLAAGADDMYDVWLRARALTDAGAELQHTFQAFTRVANLAKNAGAVEVDSSLFRDAAEQALYDAYSRTSATIARQASAQDYAGVLATMQEMAGPIDDFFAAVMVMVDDQAVRDNRLALLKAITAMGNTVGDVRKIAAI